MDVQTIFPWDDARKRGREAGFTMPFVNTDNVSRGFSVHVSVIRAGQASHPPHVHADEEVIYMLEGQAEVMIGGEVSVVGPNTAIYYPPNVRHGLRNCGDVDMRYLVVRGR